MPTTRINGADIAWREYGSGDETVVFSPGVKSDQRLWEGPAEALAERCRCITYDPRGRGRSRRPDGAPDDLEARYRDAAGLVEELVDTSCFFVGHGEGGSTGLRLAARRPEWVKGLVLINAPAPWNPARTKSEFQWHNYLLGQTKYRFGKVAGMASLLSGVPAALFGDAYLDRVGEWCRALACRREASGREVPASVRKFLDRPAVVLELTRIDAPTLVIIGLEDGREVVAGGEALVEAIDDTGMIRVHRANPARIIESPDRIVQALSYWFDKVTGSLSL